MTRDERLEQKIADAEQIIRDSIALGRYTAARAAAKQMAKLIGRRSPRQVEKMERARGLR